MPTGFESEFTIEFTLEQQKFIYTQTGLRVPAYTISVLELIAVSLAAQAADARVLPVSKSEGTIKKMLTRDLPAAGVADPFIISIRLTPGQSESIREVTGRVVQELLLAPDEWEFDCRGGEGGLQPLRVGRSLVIAVEGVNLPPSDALHVVKLPAALDNSKHVFGAGGHPTTQMSLESLEDYVERGTRVMDVGTGSGVLAIAAAKLGASHVLALDVDAASVEAAGRAVVINKLTDVVQVVTGSIEEARGSFDVVVANLFPNLLISLAARLLTCLRPGGILIATGVIAGRSDDVAAALSKEGFHILELRAKGDWRTLVMQS